MRPVNRIYVVQRHFRSGSTVLYAGSEQVFSEKIAAHLNRQSPGLLVLKEGPPEPELELESESEVDVEDADNEHWEIPDGVVESAPPLNRQRVDSDKR